MTASNEGPPGWRHEFVRLLASPSPDDRTQALDLKLQMMPDRLYRYRPPTANAFRGLLNGSVWLSAANLFNDLHDTSVHVDAHQAFGIGALARMREKLPGFVRLLPIIGRAAVSAADTLFVAAVRWESGPEDARKARGFLKRFLERTSAELSTQHTAFTQRATKVACFSEAADSPLLWGHYADSHRGFCVEYTVKDLPRDDLRLRWLLPVIYEAERFDLTRFVGGLGGRPNPFVAWLAAVHKSPEWAYEREWRIVDTVGDDVPGREIGMPKPSRVFLGHRMTPENRTTVLKLARALQIPVFEMVPSTNDFKLTAEPVNAAA